ncbi:hypothetical protein H9657_17505 [Cellulomonas sp. Sa3CUA2]|uniref:Flagellar hook-length control protein-like C-terminal domain-containing protein n=1 Tax=Cellulomonas avistercoris TaxID=2762242 RepID=A0ABR8QIA5_9CELL|nr:hypothetical protein [Cellulomonas avistercoris]
METVEPVVKDVTRTGTDKAATGADKAATGTETRATTVDGTALTATTVLDRDATDVTPIDAAAAIVRQARDTGEHRRELGPPPQRGAPGAETDPIDPGQQPAAAALSAVLSVPDAEPSARQTPWHPAPGPAGPQPEAPAVVTVTTYVAGGHVAVVAAAVTGAAPPQRAVATAAAVSLADRAAPGTGSVTPRAGPGAGPATGRSVVPVASAATTAATHVAGPAAPSCDLPNPA